MLFTDSEQYYSPEDGRYWQQGDIVLAPVALLAQGVAGAESAITAPSIGESMEHTLWQGDGAVPPVTCRAELTPAMITTHDCTLDKEFNRRYEQLRSAQLAQEPARVAAASDTSLDPYLTVAPLVPFDDAAPSARAQLEANLVIGYYPVCDSPERGIDEGVIDLLKETTIHKSLVVDRLGILSPSAIRALRYAIARFWVYRAPKLTFELEGAIGKQIVDVRISRADLLQVELELDDGDVLALLQPPTVGGDPGVERPSLSN